MRSSLDRAGGYTVAGGNRRSVMNLYELLTDDAYSLRKEGDGFRITKFSKELNPVSFYHLTPKGEDGFTCSCPQSNRGPCKHLDIVEEFTFLYPERIDKGWFYCHQTGDWFPPVETQAPMPTWMAPSPYNPAQLRVNEEGNLVPIETSEATVPPASGEGEAVPPQIPASPGATEVDGSMLPPEPPSVAPKFRRF
jgi:hypothetical protein